MRRLAALPSAGPAIDDMVAKGAAIARIAIFDWQSYHSTTLLEQAIQTQLLSQTRILNVPGANPDGTPAPIDEQVSGIGFALHPASQCPVTVLPNMEHGGGAPVVLKPGQVFYPGGQFRSFKWGMPYGWLGGGLAQLFVMQERSADLFWTEGAEVIFHRLTQPIYETGDNPSSINPNWPLRFPWPNALSKQTGSSVAQGDQPSLVVRPTKVIIRPRLTSLAASLTLRFDLWQTEDADYTFGGTLNGPAATGSFLDTFWPIFSNSGFQISSAGVIEWPEFAFDDYFFRMGGDNAILACIDKDNALGAGSFVDIIRYGRIGG